jgi:hypothetical protein
MKVNVALAAFLVLALAGAVLAQAVDGKWEAKQTTQRGEQVTTFDFKNAGGKVTGTMTRGQGQATEIKNGKLEGNKLTFEVSQAGRGGGEPVTITYTGTVGADSIKFTTAGGRGPQEIEAKKVK